MLHMHDPSRALRKGWPGDHKAPSVHHTVCTLFKYTFENPFEDGSLSSKLGCNITVSLNNNKALN